MADDEVVLYEVRDGGVAVLTLHRPDRMNAWTLEMEDQYFELLQRADADPAVRAIVVTGAGRGFSPGVDLEHLKDTRPEDIEFAQLHRPPTTLPLTIGKPIIAAINGAVAGASLVHTLQMDLRFIAEGVKMTFAFSQRGLVGEYGVTWLLPRLIGTSRALDLLLSSRVITADEALALGLVNRVLPADQLLDEAIAYATQLATMCSPRSMAQIKQQVYLDWERGLEAARVDVAHRMKESFTSPDFKEGVKSFLEKRPAEFPSLSSDLSR